MKYSCNPPYKFSNERNSLPLRVVRDSIFAIAFLLACTAEADVYSFVAEDGTHHFSDQPTEVRYTRLQTSTLESKPTKLLKRADVQLRNNRMRYAEIVRGAANSYLVEEALLHAVIEVESAYNPGAVSRKGAMGLMQLMPITAKQYGVKDPLDAEQNLKAGARHLRHLLDKFSGNKELALAAYNAGYGAVIQHGKKIPPYSETERYVPAVLLSYRRISDLH